MRAKMKRFISRFFPEYAWIPTLICVALNFFAFYGTRLINKGLTHYSMESAVDGIIPFVPAFIVVYVAAYIQWIYGFIVIGRESREFCYRFLSAEVISKIVCLVIFIAVPTTMVRPEIKGDGIFSSLTAFIYAADTPDNLFPSVHCLESVFFAVAVCKAKKTGTAAKWINAVLAVLVCASVVLVKQHVIADIAGGCFLAFFGLACARALRGERMFARFEGKRSLDDKN